jgi:hypothetical protein
MRMGTRHGWLFPLMVLAAGSVTVFGCIGIAAIIGILPLSPPAAPPAMQAVAVLPLTAAPADLTAPAPPAAEPARP